MSDKTTFNRDVFIHILCWGLIIVFPLFFAHPADPADVSLRHYARSVIGPIGYMVVFYVNYFVLIPRLLFESKLNRFLLYNLLLIAAVMLATNWWWHLMRDVLPITGDIPRPLKHPPHWPRFFQLAIMLILVVGLAVAVRMSQRWSKLQEAKKEAERTRTQAELMNLRNQLNPHFLLNTLNNIYALIAFDPDKAQTAVGELSKLLRHALYDNQKSFVPLYKEAEFIRNYIELMKIRVTDNVQIDTKIDIAPDDSTPIAPLIFISLIENAFKHGVSQSGTGHISIAMSNDGHRISCLIRNSNHPKHDNDKSGSGIGLEQVAKRLELTYHGRYSWEKGIDPTTNEYFSTITLDNEN